MKIDDIKAARNLLELKEGRNQLKVLSIIADYQLNRKMGPRQKDIVGKIFLSKGAVSNNCKELEENKLIYSDKNKRYLISEDVLIATFREYIELLFALEDPIHPYEEEMEKLNKIKKDAKDKVENILEENQRAFVTLILKVIESAQTDRSLTNLREVFQMTSKILSHLGVRYLKLKELGKIESDEISDVIKLLLSLNPKYKFLKVFLNNIPQKEV